ncbi:hypothetical protein AO1008_03716 [Aspergillus oryzae 100-8]|uniref:Uncharacterized protein n=1 Tax=Aspergillus oryzae (strain 3.042) TaxID=1160506 RepID=I7ZU77_ASPO3|nr:hypothetical protein Ao3042_08254 [Aspergillus oryzae 3.042]KDE86171.1 hypothetical protein AO1008_03716 [Aspergillus oryzae 100-8]|eukprot:EIT75512.1 hypothetical protein Ao3042_08254 [Aspergillus oryzae 3.042]
MRLQILFVAHLWLIGCVATSPPRPGDARPESAHDESRSPFPIASGHEVHLPCHTSSICGSNHDRTSKSDDYLSLAFATENDSLLVNKNIILPARLPMRLNATKHSRSQKTDPEILTLRYGMNILPVQRFQSGPITDQFRLDIILFDQSGNPTDINMISIGLSRDAHDALRITMITINPTPETSKCHGNHNPRHRHPAHSEPEPPMKHAGQSDTSESESQLHKWLDAGRRFGGKSYGSFTSAFKSRPCQEHCSERHSYPPSSYEHSRVHIVDILRVFYPAILPFLLGVVAGGAICLIGIMVRRSAAYWSCGKRRETETEGSAVQNEGESTEEKS